MIANKTTKEAIEKEVSRIEATNKLAIPNHYGIEDKYLTDNSHKLVKYFGAMSSANALWD